MISSEEACQYVLRELPDAAPAIPAECGIYIALDAVREYACEKARERNFNRLQQCFSLAATLYEAGSRTVKAAVANVFVYSISRLFAIAPEVRRQIKALLPDSLRSLYMKQVLHRGY